MKVCPHCKNPVAETDTICPYCQTLLIDDMNEYSSAAGAKTASDINQTKAKRGFFQKKSAQNDKKSKETVEANSRRQQRKAKRPTRRHVTGYFRYIYLHLRNPFPETNYPETNKEFHGSLSLMLIAIFNTLTVTGIANYFIRNYEWLSNISILPNLRFQFTPWLFALQSLLYIIVSLWLLPVIIQFLNKKVFKIAAEKKYWLSQYFGANSLALVFAFLAFILSLFAPLLFFIVNVFLLLMQLTVFVVTTTIYFLRLTNTTKISSYYWIILNLMIYIILEMVLFTLIF